MKTIDSFSGDYAFLSNFYPSPLMNNGYIYPTAEHFFQAHKFHVDDRRHAEVRDARTPGRAKKIARSHPIDKKYWDKVKVGVMYATLNRKFLYGAELGNQLKNTGDALLIEGNDWGDMFWGCVMTDKGWLGTNMLGILLMMVRQSHLRSGFKVPVLTGLWED